MKTAFCVHSDRLDAKLEVGCTQVLYKCVMPAWLDVQRLKYFWLIFSVKSVCSWILCTEKIIQCCTSWNVSVWVGACVHVLVFVIITFRLCHNVPLNWWCDLQWRDPILFDFCINVFTCLGLVVIVWLCDWIWLRSVLACYHVLSSVIDGNL